MIWVLEESRRKRAEIRAGDTGLWRHWSLSGLSRGESWFTVAEAVLDHGSGPAAWEEQGRRRPDS